MLGDIHFRYSSVETWVCSVHTGMRPLTIGTKKYLLRDEGTFSTRVVVSGNRFGMHVMRNRDLPKGLRRCRNEAAQVKVTIRCDGPISHMDIWKEVSATQGRSEVDVRTVGLFCGIA